MLISEFEISYKIHKIHGIKTKYFMRIDFLIHKLINK
jgi:hypothetical protein